MHFLLRDKEVFGCNVTVFGLSDALEGCHYGAQEKNRSSASKLPTYHNFLLEHNVLRKMAAVSMLPLYDERIAPQAGPDKNKRASPSWKYVEAFRKSIL